MIGRLIIPQRNIVADAVSYIKLYNNRTESHMRSWLHEQEYVDDYHYFEGRLMTRDNIIKRYNTEKNEYVFYYV